MPKTAAAGMPTKSSPMIAISIRLPADLIGQLPAPALSGERAEFIRKAVVEKLARDKKAKARKSAKPA